MNEDQKEQLKEQLKKQFKPLYCYGIWFIGNAERDWMGQMFIRDGKWMFYFRFRYYDPDSRDPFDGKDRKSSYCYAAKDDSDAERDRMLKTTRELVPMLEVEFKAEMDFVDMQCFNNDPKFVDKLSARPWAHVKVVEDHK